jgi:hypothetical protein
MIHYRNTTTGQIRQFETKNGRIITTIKIAGRWVSNPTIDQFKNEGWEEYTPPTPEPYITTYKERVVQLVRERYDTDDEIALLRQRDEKPEEFAEYNAFVESCKEQARNETEKN